jgi:hypothetical protein
MVKHMTTVLVAFLIVFVQMSADSAICHELMSAKADQSCQVQMSKMADSRCTMGHCATRCNLASQEQPFSVPKSTDQELLNPTQIAPVLNPVIMESFSPTPFLWPSAAKEPSEFGVEVYLLNASFLI